MSESGNEIPYKTEAESRQEAYSGYLKRKISEKQNPPETEKSGRLKVFYYNRLPFRNMRIPGSVGKLMHPSEIRGKNQILAQVEVRRDIDPNSLIEVENSAGITYYQQLSEEEIKEAKLCFKRQNAAGEELGADAEQILFVKPLAPRELEKISMPNVVLPLSSK